MLKSQIAGELLLGGGGHPHTLLVLGLETLV